MVEFNIGDDKVGYITQNISFIERTLKNKILINPKEYIRTINNELVIDEEIYNSIEVNSVENSEYNYSKSDYRYSNSIRTQVFLSFPYPDLYLWKCFNLSKIIQRIEKKNSDYEFQILKFQNILLDSSTSLSNFKRHKLKNKTHLSLLKNKIVFNLKQSYDYNEHLHYLKLNNYSLVSKEDYYNINNFQHSLYLSFLPFINKIPKLYKSFNNQLYFEKFSNNNCEVHFLANKKDRIFHNFLIELEEYKKLIEDAFIKSQNSCNLTELKMKANQINDKLSEIFNDEK